MAAAAAVDIGALDLDAGDALGFGDLFGQGVAVIGAPGRARAPRTDCSPGAAALVVASETEHALDLDTRAVGAAEMHAADRGDTATLERPRSRSPRLPMATALRRARWGSLRRSARCLNLRPSTSP